jgi:hypothetical protein
VAKFSFGKILTAATKNRVKGGAKPLIHIPHYLSVDSSHHHKPPKNNNNRKLTRETQQSKLLSGAENSTIKQRRREWKKRSLLFMSPIGLLQWYMSSRSAFLPLPLPLHTHRELIQKAAIEGQEFKKEEFH